MTKNSKTRKWIISSVVLLLLIVSMTISDRYYSKLEKEFPVLEKDELVEGIITRFKNHFEYTYLEIDSNTKRLIRPTRANDTDLIEFHDFIKVGDKFLHRKSDNRIYVFRQDEKYEFPLISQPN